ncbi:MAG: hypothetical protein ACLFVC_07025 [Opitutales bacterium]
MSSYTLWVDEAESSINGLTILEHGLPVSEYLGQPIYENTLTEPWPGHPEYEFKDSSYSDRGLVVYHGWLPLYAIAAAQALAGIEPDSTRESHLPAHDRDDVFFRTVVPRMPAILFSLGYLTVVYALIRQVAGPGAAITSLTWLSLGFYGVRFGHQARYYSLTLLMSALCAWAAWNVYRRGRLRDFALLGLAEAGLFHTHPLSAVIFATTCCLLAPRILQHPRWFRKCAVAATIAAGLTVPWALLSGFFDTASSVPKGFQLFQTWTDWAHYALERPIPLLVFATLCALLVVSRSRRYLTKESDRVPENRTSLHVFAFLIAWIAIAYLAFHLLVPAASLFFERLTLIVLTPLAVFMGMVLAEFYPARKPWATLGIAIALPLGILFITNDLPKAPRQFEDSKRAVAGVIDYFNEHGDAVPMRVYSTPNQHLVWTYYLGIPVQSIAPVRRSFLESYAGDLFFLESNWLVTFPDAEKIRNALAASGPAPGETEVEAIQLNLSHNLVREELIERGFAPEAIKAAPIPEEIGPYFESLLAEDARNQRAQFERSQAITVLQAVDADNTRDLWLGFFYRFSDYASRIGPNLNIWPIMRRSKIEILPESGVTVFYRPEPSQ